MHTATKLLTSLGAAAALAVVVSGSAWACSYHGASASVAVPQTVAQVPAPLPPAPKPGKDG